MRFRSYCIWLFVYSILFCGSTLWTTCSKVGKRAALPLFTISRGTWYSSCVRRCLSSLLLSKLKGFVQLFTFWSNYFYLHELSIDKYLFRFLEFNWNILWLLRKISQRSLINTVETAETTFWLFEHRFQSPKIEPALAVFGCKFFRIQMFNDIKILFYSWMF